MTDPKADVPETDEEIARRRDEALRRLLNTPPKPHKAEAALKKETGRDKPGRSRSGKQVKERGES